MTCYKRCCSSTRCGRAREGRVTGRGLAGKMCRIFRTWAVTAFVALLFIANTINSSGDFAAMSEAVELVLGWRRHVFTQLFAVFSRILQVMLVPFHWTDVDFRTVIPQLALTGAKALFGTTNIRAIQPGYHRYRAARCACTGRIGSLRQMRPPVENRTGAQATGGGRALYSCRVRRARRPRGRLFAIRSDPGARLPVASSAPEPNFSTV